MEPIKYVCSLGAVCFSAFMIKRNNLKQCSYPFDWVFSKTDMVISCIEDNFQTFLDKKHHVSVYNKDEPRSTHLIYTSPFFSEDPQLPLLPHHDITRPETYAYFERCVVRFRLLLKTTERKLFVISPKSGYMISSDKIERLNTLLNNYTSNYELLIISHKISNEVKHIITKNGNITYITLSASEHNGVKFINDEHNSYLDNILHSLYTFDVVENPHST
jgi:hypothetical protein